MAKVEHYYTRFENEGIYHVYNRTVDRKSMFASEENYAYFIRQFDKYLSDYVKIYAYNLLGNHFHFMIKINDLSHLTSDENINYNQDLTTFEKLSNFRNDKNIEKLSNLSKPNPKTTHDIVSHQFKKFFQSYAMAYNKQQNRVGTLFQTPFKRVRVDDENYLRELACYINTNAQKHDLVTDFRQWKWSSYANTISNNKTKLLKEDLINYFGGVANFKFSHEDYTRKMGSIERDFFIED